MESRFSKYESNGQALSSHIANVNLFIDNLYANGLDLIEKEIKSLTEKINNGSAYEIFQNKIEKLVRLGKSIEEVHEVYNFNKGTSNAA